MLNERQIGDYQRMMRDRVRMRAYERAIRQVCPGRIVCEIGVGLGPLSLMALKAGATRVYGIEASADVLAMAQQILRGNGFDARRFVPIRGLSHEVELPERVDVILSETLDSTALGENTAFYMEDARQRLLAPNGVFLPRRVDCHLALASPSEFEADCAFWRIELPNEFGLDYSGILPRVRVNNRTLAIPTEEIHSDWKRWLTVDFSDPASALPPDPLLLQTRSAEIITGVAMAFEAELADGVSIRTFPEDAPTHWKQGFSPFRKPVACRRGDGLWLEVTLPRSESPWIALRTRHLHIRAPRVLEFMSKIERSAAQDGAGATPR